jgi:PAS domain S-box-containing protein
MLQGNKRESQPGPRADGTPKAAGTSVEDMIQRAKSQLEQMIDLNPESMVLVDGVGSVLRANRSFVTLLGATNFGGVLGHTLTELFPFDDPSFFPSLLADRKDCESREIQVRLGDGRERLMRFTVVAGGQDTETLVVIAHDATHERLQAELIEKAYKVEAIRALMGALMHHLNQPLTVLMVRARLMQQALEKGQLDPETLKATFHDIMELTMRMANVLKKVEESDDYQTQEYIRGLDILKIDD